MDGFGTLYLNEKWYNIYKNIIKITISLMGVISIYIIDYNFLSVIISINMVDNALILFLRYQVKVYVCVSYVIKNLND